MRFSVEIEMGNAAFADDHPGELIRLLRIVCRDLRAGNDFGTLDDINGNTVGCWGECDDE